ncbi:MAG: ATP-dependent 6-phosphofructokinase [Ruminococcaceae bacterium]|nr:ATP-dependent 6-phosphofructokinase [Oscillospiraceae bacterium]
MATTQKQIKRIAILTSGGDAPGMNAAIRAAARAALNQGIEVYGVYEGYQGLIDANMKLYKSPRELCNIINKSGTYLYTARCDDFKTPEGMAKVLENCKRRRIGGVIAIGGDGTFRGATDLSKHGIPTIGIPGTIDNDITSTDVTIGFDTAMNTAMNLIDNLRDTCESHARCNVIEVMGRWSGNIALRTGVASGASAIAIPEIPFDEDAAIKKIIEQKEHGKRSFIVVVSEGLVGYAEKLAKTIQEKTGIETKFAKFAHVQRGGKPTLQDRLLASELGYTAIQYLLEGKSDIVVCKEDGKIGYKNISDALLVDRMFKKKMTEEEYAALSAEDKEWMEARCAKLLADMQRLYDIANNIC